MKAVFGKIVYDGAKSLANAYVLVDGERIAGISGERPECEIAGEYEAITPAFIDAHCHIGMDRAGEPFNESDVNEHMDALMIEGNALDSVQMDDRSFSESVEAGVLYSCVMPGSGNVIGGRTALIRNFSGNSNDAFIKGCGIKAALGYNPKSTTEWKGTRPSTRMGAVAMLRGMLKRGMKAKGLLEKEKKVPEEIDPAEEAVMGLLEGKDVLRVHVHKEDDITALVRLKNEFGIRVTIEHAADVHKRETFELVKREGIPLVYGPVDSFAYKVELKHESWRNIAHLIASGIEFGLMSDHPVILQRNLFLQLRHFLRFGMAREECIGLITRRNAKICGVDDELGGIGKGKLASLVCWKGDPFVMGSHPSGVYAEGKEILFE